MKNLLFLSLLILFACKGMNDNDDESNLPDDFDMNNWIDENTILKHKNLLSFDIEYQDYSKDFTPQNNTILPQPQIQYEKDSIVVVFYETVWVGCPIIGNVRIENDTIKLLYDNVCHPDDDELINEEVDLELRYVLKNDAIFQNKVWKAESRNLQKK